MIVSLNKSKIKAGMFCQRRLWLSEFRQELVPPQSAMSELLLARGIEVGELARAYFPDGVLVEWEPSPELNTFHCINTLVEAMGFSPRLLVNCGAWERRNTAKEVTQFTI